VGRANIAIALISLYHIAMCSWFCDLSYALTPRPMELSPRAEFAEDFYHVIVRGNQRQKVFRDDKDRLAYLERKWKLISMAILPNPIPKEG